MLLERVVEKKVAEVKDRVDKRYRKLQKVLKYCSKCICMNITTNKMVKSGQMNSQRAKEIKLH